MAYKTLRLNLACNADCLFCNVPPESKEAGELNTKQAKERILTYIKDGYTDIDISGGEPTLRKDLPELIKFALKNGTKDLELQTNAILLEDADYAKKLRRAGLKKAFVGLHSHIPEIHDFLLGRKNSHKKCLKGIRNLINSKIEVALNPVLTAKSYMYFPEYLKFILEEFPEVKNISLSVVQPHGRAWKNRFLLPRLKVIDPFIRAALDKYMGKLNIFNPYCGLPLCIGGWWQYLDSCMEFLINRRIYKEGKVPPPDPNKIKVFVCSECDLKAYCNGVWKEYWIIYPYMDIKPLKFNKSRIPVKYKHG